MKATERIDLMFCRRLDLFTDVRIDFSWPIESGSDHHTTSKVNAVHELKKGVTVTNSRCSCATLCCTKMCFAVQWQWQWQWIGATYLSHWWAELELALPLLDP